MSSTDASAAAEKKALAKEVNIPLSSSNSSAEEYDVEDGEYRSQGRHIFSDEKIAAHWRGIYEEAKYEGRHRFDPEFKWTAEEEKKVLKKIDARIMWWTWVRLQMSLIFL